MAAVTPIFAALIAAAIPCKELFDESMVTVLAPLPSGVKVAPACSVKPLTEVLVSAFDVTNVVPLVMEAMVVPGGKPSPVRVAPTARLAVLATVTVLPSAATAALLNVAPYCPVVEFKVLPVMVPKLKDSVVVPPAPMGAVWLAVPFATSACACARAETVTE